MDIRPIDANALKTKAHITRTRALDNLTIEIASVSVDEIDNAPTLSLNALRDAIYQDAVEHGLWEEHDKNCPELSTKLFDLNFDQVRRLDCASYIDGECEELFDAIYNANAYAEELADVIIMSMSVAGKLGIDIDTAIRRKMEINKGRAWKHEGEKK